MWRTADSVRSLSFLGAPLSRLIAGTSDSADHCRGRDELAREARGVRTAGELHRHTQHHIVRLDGPGDVRGTVHAAVGAADLVAVLLQDVRRLIVAIGRGIVNGDLPRARDV